MKVRREMITNLVILILIALVVITLTHFAHQMLLELLED